MEEKEYKYKCKHCGYILVRNFKKSHINSICGKVGKNARPKLIKDEQV